MSHCGFKAYILWSLVLCTNFRMIGEFEVFKAIKKVLCTPGDPSKVKCFMFMWTALKWFIAQMFSQKTLDHLFLLEIHSQWDVGGGNGERVSRFCHMAPLSMSCFLVGFPLKCLLKWSPGVLVVMAEQQGFPSVLLMLMLLYSRCRQGPFLQQRLLETT